MGPGARIMPSLLTSVLASLSIRVGSFLVETRSPVRTPGYHATGSVTAALRVDQVVQVEVLELSLIEPL